LGLGKIFSALTRNIIGTITHVATSDSVAALTFDDGPHPDFTARLLEILAKHGVRATFFMIGEAAQRYPDLVRKVGEAGHTIGNHSWDHSAFPLLSGRERRAQISRCQKAIAPYGKKLFRPPFGYQDLASRLDAFWLGYQVITWNVVAWDWLDRDSNWMVDYLTNKIRPGSIIILHDALNHVSEERYAQRESTLTAVSMFLERFRGHFRFLTVPELLEYGRPVRRNWYWKADRDWLDKLKKTEV
jgi:peptidoglycan/xylan/chitin deacetylase (PgdA/CDA1 family)